jgi:DNA-binding PadR family transcriptional regulator
MTQRTHQTAWQACSGFQRDLLIAIASQTDPNGLEIKANLEDTHPDSGCAPRLYTNLDELADRGLVAKESAQPSSTYRLTEQGEAVLREAAERLTAVVEPEGQG